MRPLVFLLVAALWLLIGSFFVVGMACNFIVRRLSAVCDRLVED